jgi:hypothetical protein
MDLVQLGNLTAAFGCSGPATLRSSSASDCVRWGCDEDVDSRLAIDHWIRTQHGLAYSSSKRTSDVSGKIMPFVKPQRHVPLLLALTLKTRRLAAI